MRWSDIARDDIAAPSRRDRTARRTEPDRQGRPHTPVRAGDGGGDARGGQWLGAGRIARPVRTASDPAQEVDP